MDPDTAEALDHHDAIRVLIVEDRPVARKLLEAELVQAHGIEIAAVAQDGIEALTKIREFSDVPVILLTGAKVATESLEHVARKKGADGFFIKPSGSVSVDLYSISEP